jgi:hypothetical protein
MPFIPSALCTIKRAWCAGVVKLSDFGSSKRLGTGGDELDAQMLAGTFTGSLALPPLPGFLSARAA